MANTNITLTSLDFTDYKNSLKTFLQSQSQFQDYNFDGSNLSVILDLLSYNTYMNAFYMNMVASEMFLDTAQQRDSVVLRAKELNYVPRSFRSSYALVDLVVANVNPSIILLTIPSGTSFTGRAGTNNYTFSTNQTIVVQANTDGKFYASNVAIYEGTSVTDTFTVQPASNTDVQQFTLSNPTIDTTSLSVVSIENGGANVIPYILSTTLLDLTSNSNVYFLQGADNSQYQIIFGDNVVGRRPADQAIVAATYLVTNGQLPNGIATFTPNGTLGSSSNITVNTVSPAQGGDIGEDINSIRFNAPRYFATQERAVTTSDYETLLTVTYPEIQAISVYGGETTSPTQYGKVFISLKLYNFDNIPQDKVTEYSQFLATRAPLTIIPVFVEPDYTYASVATTVKYNINQTTLQPADISTFVISAIQTYNLQYLDNFASTLLYSRLVEAIDSAHPSIISNQTEYSVMKKLLPTSATQNYTLTYNMPFNTEGQSGTTITSTQYIVDGVYYTIEDTGASFNTITQTYTGNLIVSGQPSNVVGTVDFTNGVITLTNFFVDSYVGDAIRFYCQLPENVKDVSTSQNVIFEIPNDEIIVNVQIVRQ